MKESIEIEKIIENEAKKLDIKEVEKVEFIKSLVDSDKYGIKKGEYYRLLEDVCVRTIDGKFMYSTILTGYNLVVSLRDDEFVSKVYRDFKHDKNIVPEGNIQAIKYISYYLLNLNDKQENILRLLPSEVTICISRYIDAYNMVACEFGIHIDTPSDYILLNNKLHELLSSDNMLKQVKGLNPGDIYLLRNTLNCDTYDKFDCLYSNLKKLEGGKVKYTTLVGDKITYFSRFYEYYNFSSNNDNHSEVPKSNSF